MTGIWKRARGDRIVVGWGRCGRTMTQTQVLRAGVPWSSRAGHAWFARGPEWPCPPNPRSAAFFTASWVCSGIVKGTASAKRGPSRYSGPLILARSKHQKSFQMVIEIVKNVLDHKKLVQSFQISFELPKLIMHKGFLVVLTSGKEPALNSDHSGFGIIDNRQLGVEL